MKILGLTGSIAMGKSATAAMFADKGVPVYDADAAVHALYEKGGAAVKPVGMAFPGVVKDGAIDRAALREAVLGKSEALNRLNSIVHPLVARSQMDFRARALQSDATFAVLDIPLLFETGGETRCDYISVVTAPAEVQKMRVMARGTMTEEDFEAILARQTPDAEKRARADFIISTAFGFQFTEDQVDAIIGLMSRLAEEESE